MGARRLSEGVRELPVFPLGTVLFPEGKLPLRIFEPRYVDMVARCGREGFGFVVVAIKEGREAGKPAIPHSVGTEVRLENWDTDENGLLLIECQGVAKVSINSSRLLEDGLRMAEVTCFENELELPVEAKDQHLWAVLAELGVVPESQAQRNVYWLGARLVERLPLPLELKQELLCLQNPQERLQVINHLVVGFLKA